MGEIYVRIAADPVHARQEYLWVNVFGEKTRTPYLRVQGDVVYSRQSYLSIAEPDLVYSPAVCLLIQVTAVPYICKPIKWHAEKGTWFMRLSSVMKEVT